MQTEIEKKIEEIVCAVAMPKEVQEELERLHLIILSECHCSYKNSAIKLIEQIHSFYFKGQLIIRKAQT